jgi:glycosyltransferase involved in cell wall biosynthesis
VYNEKNTVEELLATVIDKKLNGLDKEIIVVESNSTDGSKEIVKKFEGQKSVRIIWEESPKGKGRAVRNGISQANGDFILKCRESIGQDGAVSHHPDQ